MILARGLSAQVVSQLPDGKQEAGRPEQRATTCQSDPLLSHRSFLVGVASSGVVIPLGSGGSGLPVVSGGRPQMRTLQGGFPGPFPTSHLTAGVVLHP